jgi:hypothetical protein
MKTEMQNMNENFSSAEKKKFAVHFMLISIVILLSVFAKAVLVPGSSTAKSKTISLRHR